MSARVAVVELWPRVCGATLWSLHAALGLERIGCDVERVTFSKSGKRLAAWGRPGKSWTPHKVRDAVDVLSKFDLVVLSDVVCRAPEVSKGGDAGWHVQALDRAGTPWTTMIHDACYPARYRAVVQELVAGRSFSGVLVTTRARDTIPWFVDFAGGLFAPRVEWVVNPYLPYDPSLGPSDPGRHSPGALMNSRMMSNKGQAALLEVFGDLPADSEVWGHCSFGVATSVAWGLWELAEKLGYEPVVEPILRADKASLTHPNARKHYTGPFAVRDRDRVYTYRGGFDVPDDVEYARATVGLSLTNDSLRGTIEYATLDAIAGGLVAVVPEHAVEEAEYESLVTVPFRSRSLSVSDGAVREGRTDWNRDAIVATLSRYLDASSADAISTRAMAQRLEVARLHDPAIVARSIVEKVGLKT